MVTSNVLEVEEFEDGFIPELDERLGEEDLDSRMKERATDIVMSSWALPRRFTPVLESTLYDPKLERRNYGI